MAMSRACSNSLHSVPGPVRLRESANPRAARLPARRSPMVHPRRHDGIHILRPRSRPCRRRLCGARFHPHASQRHRHLRRLPAGGTAKPSSNVCPARLPPRSPATGISGDPTSWSTTDRRFPSLSKPRPPAPCSRRRKRRGLEKPAPRRRRHAHPAHGQRIRRHHGRVGLAATARHHHRAGTYSLKPGADWGVYGNSTHAGGVSDGTDGAAVFNYSRLGVAAKKSWFFFGDVMVALGPRSTLPPPRILF